MPVSSLLHRFSTALRDNLQGCASPRSLRGGGEEVKKATKSAETSNSPDVYVLTDPHARPSLSIPSEWLFSTPCRPPSLSERLPPVDHPADKLQAALAMLSISAHTDPQMALTTLCQLALNNPAVLQPRLAEVVPLVVNHVRCLLPGLSHLATMLLTELLAAFGDGMAQHCQDRRDPDQSVVLQLLLKASVGAGAKAFVVEGAQLALRTLADKLSPSQAAELLQPYALHKQPRVRDLAGVLLEAVQAREAGGRSAVGGTPAAAVAAG